MAKVTFQLRAGAKESFSGGTFALQDGSTFDIAAALKKGDGKIVVDASDQYTVEALHNCPVLEEATSAKAPSKDKED